MESRMTLCTGETGPNPPVPFFHPQGPKYIMTTVFPRSPASIETSSISRLSMLPSAGYHQDIRLCSWPRSPYIGNADDMRDLHFFTFNQEPCYISTLHLRHSTTQPSLCEYISATARHCVMEVSECVRIKPPFHPSSTSTMHSTQHWSQSQKLGSLLAFPKTFTQKGGLKVHACSSCEFI